MGTFICEHQINISMCKIHDCEKCGHKGNEANCPMAKNSSDSAIPTFEQALDLFKKGSSSCSRKANVISQIRNALMLVGLDTSSKLVEMTYDKFELLIERLKGERAFPVDAGFSSSSHFSLVSSRPHRNKTIESYLAAFNSITSNEMQTAFRKNGLTPFKFAKPKFDPPSEMKQFVTYDQIRKVQIEMEKCFASGRKSDLKVALMIFFDIYLGLRAGEICHLKWGNIQLTEEGVKLVHTPRKTLRFHPDPVSIPIRSEDLAIIRPFIGKPDEHVIPLETKFLPKTRQMTKHGHYSRMHAYSRNKANRIFAMAGIGTEYRGQKKMHAGRKFRETVDAAKYGDAVSASWRGHSERIAHQNYISDPSTLTAGSSHPLVAA